MNKPLQTIGVIGAATRRPARFVSLHLFNPVPLMAPVEVAHGSATALRTVEVAGGQLGRKSGRVFFAY